MSKKTVIKLDKPFEFEGEKITQLQLREPKVFDLEIMQNAGVNPITQMAALVASLSGLPNEVINEIHATDFTEISEKVGYLLGK